MRKIEVKNRMSGGRQFFLLCFWLWAVLVGLASLSSWMSAEGISGLGVGTSAAVTMRLTGWIGGMVLFGLAALACPTHPEVRIIDDV